MGLHSTLFNSLPRQAYVTAEHAENAIARHRDIGRMVDELSGRLVDAASNGVTPHSHTVMKTIEAIEQYLATDVSSDRLLTVADPKDVDQELVQLFESLRS